MTARPVVVTSSVVVLAAALGLLPRWAGLPHLVALPPLDVFADVRLLLAWAPNGLVFVGGLAAVVAARVALLAWWVGGGSTRRRRALVFYLVVLPPAVLVAGLDFAGRALHYAWFVWMGLALVVATVIIAANVPWSWVAGTERRRATATVAGYLAVLTALGGVVASAGEFLTLVAVPVSGALTIHTVGLLTGTEASMARGLRVAGAVAAGAATVAIVLALGAPLLARARPAAAPTAAPRPGSVFLVAGTGQGSGQDALFLLDPTAIGYPCRQTVHFSYAGPGSGAPQGESFCPIRTGAPYTADDTHRSLEELAGMFDEQLAQADPPVVVVAHSQGVWVAWAALSRAAPDTVSDLVLVGGFTDTLASFPPPGRSGTGAVGGTATRALVAVSRAAGITSFDPDAPPLADVQAGDDTLSRLFATPLVGEVRALDLVAVHDLPLRPDTLAGSRVDTTCPVPSTHGSLVTSPWAERAIVRFLAGDPPEDCRPWAWWPERLTRGFGAPPP